MNEITSLEEHFKELRRTRHTQNIPICDVFNTEAFYLIKFEDGFEMKVKAHPKYLGVRDIKDNWHYSFPRVGKSMTWYIRLGASWANATEKVKNITFLR